MAPMQYFFPVDLLHALLAPQKSLICVFLILAAMEMLIDRSVNVGALFLVMN